MSYAERAAMAGVPRWFDYQLDAFVGMARQTQPLRACLYFRTGAGKSITAAVAVAQAGAERVLVVAPPITHPAWHRQCAAQGLDVETISHAKFRMKDYKVSRDTAIIADEFHMFGGNTKQGWKKLDAVARGLRAPLIIMSATPEYNDVERVYCVKHILDPQGTKGGFLEFVYAECVTEQNAFGMMPNIIELRNYPSAEVFLASLPGVYYLPDTTQWSIQDLVLPAVPMCPGWHEFGYDERSHRIMASGMEERHKRINNIYIDNRGYLRGEIYDIVADLVNKAKTPSLVFAMHSTVAEAFAKLLYLNKVKHAVITGTTPKKKKDAYVEAFRDGVLDVLVGTASLATGTDGLDKVCDQLIILDDTDDDAQRTQLAGRIMPRGADADASKKRVYRLNP